MPQTKDTSWTKSAKWYQDAIAKDDSYQKTVIIPHLTRLMDIKPGQCILDVGCGTGLFCREWAKAGARVAGVDMGPDLIALAKSEKTANVDYHVADASNLDFLHSESFDQAVIVLALQNMLDLHGVIRECSRLIKPKGKIILVLNHPAYRIPQASTWGWDEEKNIQYRRIDKYLSEEKVEILMHPGNRNSEITYSFHRSLQTYFKAFAKHNLAVIRLEEWISPRETPHGPRAHAENFSRKEFPLFLFLELQKI